MSIYSLRLYMECRFGGQAGNALVKSINKKCRLLSSSRQEAGWSLDRKSYFRSISMCRQGKGVAISSFDFSIFDLDISRWQSITFLSQWLTEWMQRPKQTFAVLSVRKRLMKPYKKKVLQVYIINSLHFPSALELEEKWISSKRVLDINPGISQGNKPFWTAGKWKIRAQGIIEHPSNINNLED